MMYTELFQYLLFHKELSVPGIGTFFLERKPAANDFFNKRINPPAYIFALQPTSNLPPKKFFNWLSVALHISYQDAVLQFDNFAVNIKQQISKGGIIDWKGVGVLSKGLAGEIKFKPEKEMILEKPVTAEKIIRLNAEHMVRVGEDNKTSAEMVELLNQTQEKKSFWWAYALSLALLCIIFIGWYVAGHGSGVSATANIKGIVPQESVPTYKSLP